VLRSRGKSMNKKFFVIQFFIGIIVALIAAAIMIDGSIFGENHAGIASILGIIGIGIIASSSIWTIKK
jgi:energy-converting hydrogenase Eha subunit H